VHIQYANYADKIGKGIKIANKQIKSTIELLELKPENTVKIIVFNVKDGIFRNSSPHWTIDNANTKEKDHGLYSKYDFQQLSKCQDCIFFLSEYSENKRLGLNYILPNLESKHYQDFILPRLLDNKCKDIERCKNECLKIATKRKDGIWDITGSSLNETS
ncbi:hypothetical protein KC853_01530, partial [Candidatus Saccharibacteria bacterium]|nr:hypothetical protein [Candidatus Saccharibacteria bacterium]